MLKHYKPAFSHPSWQIASRVCAAIIGGYTFTSAFTILLAALLPLPKAEAVLGASLPGFAVYVLTIIWVFATNSVTKIWAYLLIGSTLMTGAGLLIGGFQS